LLTSSAISKFKQYIQKTVAYARYRVGTTYYQIPILRTEVLADGRVAIYLLIDHSVPGQITINQIQLFDVDNDLWLEKPESITRKDTQEGVLIRITFTIQEV
jgi:hypothetical protein